MVSEEVWLLRRRGSPGAVADFWSSWNPSCGHLVGKGDVWGRDRWGTLDTQPSLAPPRNPAGPLQRGDRDTKERLVPGPSAAVRVAAVPLPGWGIPGASGGAGGGDTGPALLGGRKQP